MGDWLMKVDVLLQWSGFRALCGIVLGAIELVILVSIRILGSIRFFISELTLSLTHGYFWHAAGFPSQILILAYSNPRLHLDNLSISTCSLHNSLVRFYRRLASE